MLQPLEGNGDGGRDGDRDGDRNDDSCGLCLLVEITPERGESQVPNSLLCTKLVYRL